MFEDTEKAEKLTGRKHTGSISVSTQDYMAFFEETLDILGKVGMSEIERTTNRYNI